MGREKIEQHWTDHAEKTLVGHAIKGVRYLTREEAAALGWFSRPLVIELDNGTLLFAASDDEGNDGGALFGQTGTSEELTFPRLR